MKYFLKITFFFLSFTTTCLGQLTGNSVQVGYTSMTTNNRAVANNNTLFIKARVLHNIKADRYVAVFGISDTAKTVFEANTRINKRINGFTSNLKNRGVSPEDIYIDITTQTKIYDYNIQNGVATQFLDGFEIKKNVNIAFKDLKKMETFMLAAAQFEIFDIIKVDYIIEDLAALEDQLFEEALAILNKKKKRYVAAMGIDISKRATITSEGFTTAYPNSLYKRYTTNASSVYKDSSKYAKRLDVIKTPTYYYEGISNANFDSANNPVLLEPMIQCVFEMEMSYRILE